MAEVPLVDATPSRLVGESKLPSYMASVSSQFLILQQATDPFGLYQDPAAKPVIKRTVAKSVRRVAPVQATPFADVIRLLKVNTVMPGEKKFLIDTRTVREGEKLSIHHRGRMIVAEVVSVSSSRILFRNTAGSETAALPLNLLPAGMSAGTQGITAPGLTPSHANAIIELDPGINPDDSSPPNPSEP